MAAYAEEETKSGAPSRVSVGIDLGTTYSCVGVWQNERVEIIANDMGTRTTPSYVAFTEQERLVGDAAKNQISLNAANTVFDAKRLIGRKFEEECVQEDIKRWPFEVVEGEHGEPKIRVTSRGEVLELAPEEISAMVLKKMRETAESYLGREVDSAVVTVPAYFNDAQRQATHRAAKVAGLEILRILNEPTAAALAYGLESKEKKKSSAEDEEDQEEEDDDEMKTLIFDLGGGTLDVSLLAMSKGVFEVKATAGNTHLGGEDFDNRMVDFMCQEFGRRYKGKDLKSSPRALRRLRSACERAKRRLSSASTATVEIEGLFEGLDFEYSLSRAKFESLNSDLFQSCLEPVERVLKDARIRKKKKIDAVVLVGGSTRIPKIRALLSGYFDGKSLETSAVNPDEAVAYGAAIQAAILSEQTGDTDAGAGLGELLLVDVTPLSMGIEINGNTMSTLLKRNTRIPAQKSQPYTTTSANQTAVHIRVFEGERQFTKDNHFLGEFTMHGIPPGPAGSPKIDVDFAIDANGILNVKATCESTGTSQEIQIKRDDQLSSDQVEKMVKDAEIFDAQDRALHLKVTAKSQLDTVCAQLLRATWDADDPLYSKLDEASRSELADKVRDVEKWANKETTLDLSEPSDFQERQRDLEAFVASVAQQRRSKPPDSEVVYEDATDDDDDDDLPDLVEADDGPAPSTAAGGTTTGGHVPSKPLSSPGLNPGQSIPSGYDVPPAADDDDDPPSPRRDRRRPRLPRRPTPRPSIRWRRRRHLDRGNRLGGAPSWFFLGRWCNNGGGLAGSYLARCCNPNPSTLAQSIRSLSSLRCFGWVGRITLSPHLRASAPSRIRLGQASLSRSSSNSSFPLPIVV